MNILFTTENGETKNSYFPPDAIAALQALGTVQFNEKDTPLTPEELAEAVRDIDVCITHWGCPKFTPRVLQYANRLQLIAHAAGSVADLVTDEVYERGIKVISANRVMAKYVAEGVLAYILTALRYLPQQNDIIKNKMGWEKKVLESRSLYDAKLGLIGLGTIGRILLHLIEPFQVKVKLYDPYVSLDTLADHPNVALASLDEVLSWGDVISVHASLTRETRGMLNAQKLKLIKDKALFVNTARAGIIHEQALLNELRLNRFDAILDVYWTEPLPVDSPFRSLENVLLLPHVAGIAYGETMTFSIIDELKGFIDHKPLQHEISRQKFLLMTQEG